MSLTILCGDALEQLRTLPDESVQCVVTSPPYWGLRDYGTGTWDGGDAACSHTNKHQIQGATGERAGRAFTGAQNYYRVECGKCGAVRIDKQIGLEKTPEEFVTKMVAVFAEVRRVLKADGTCWVNMGDCYAGGGNGGGGSFAKDGIRASKPGSDKNVPAREGSRGCGNGLKPKDMVGIPWRVAFALQADGWYLRQDIIWHKPNPMPESVQDRCTKAHEYLFLLAKSERYFYDAEAIREDAKYGRVTTPNERPREGRGAQSSGTWRRAGDGQREVDRDIGGEQAGKTYYPSAGRNKRSVWTVPTFAFSEAHFATYPPALITPCILAGTKPGDTVLDPFAGSGTTLMVAMELGRNALGVELNPDYIKLIEHRCNVTPGLPL